MTGFHKCIAVLVCAVSLMTAAFADSVTATVTVGSTPYAVAVNPVTNKMYVANEAGNSVTVIDGATNTTATVTVGTNPYAVAVNPVTNMIYVADYGNAKVTVINGVDNSTATVSVGTNPKAIAVNPITNKIYVANYGSANVTVIDGVTNDTTTVTATTDPQAIAINTVTDTIYVADYGAAKVTVINGATNATSSVTVGTNPYDIAVNPITNEIYVADYGNAKVTVINGVTNATITVTVGTNPRAVAVNDITNEIYVANYGSASITVINGATNATTSVTVGTDPYAVAVNPVSNKVYVPNYGSSNVSVINGATNAVTATLTAATHPYAVAVNPVTDKIYVPNNGSASVTVIDGSLFSTATVTVGAGPEYAAVNSTTHLVYVSDFSDGTVDVIDEATGTVTATISLGSCSQPSGIAVNPLTNRIYVACYGSWGLAVIDGSSNAVLTTIPSIPQAQVVAINPVTNQVYVTQGGHTAVSVIDGATNAMSSIPVGSGPDAIAVNPITNKIYVACGSSGTVTVIDGATETTTTIVAGTYPFAIDIDPLTNKIYAANNYSNNVTVIDGVTNNTITLTVGTGPFGVAVNSVTNKIYVTNSNSANVTVIDGATNGMVAVPAGAIPESIAVNIATNKVYVGSYSGAAVTVIDGATNTTGTLSTGANPDRVIVDPVTSIAFVLNYAGNSVTVINEAPRISQSYSAAPQPLAYNISTSLPAFTLNATDNNDNPITPLGVYWTIDSEQLPWAAATASGDNSFTATVTAALTSGYHVLYTYPVQGDVANPATDRGTPRTGDISAYSFTVNGMIPPQSQTITFPNPGTQTYGETPFSLAATASSGLAVTYRVISGPATVSGSVLTITAAGSVTVEADQAGDEQWYAAPAVQVTFTVTKAVLTVTATSLNMTYGGQVPFLTFSYSGFVNGDGQGVVSGSPSLATTGTSHSPAGSYPITVTQGTLAAVSYSFVFVNGTLTINHAVLRVMGTNLSMSYGSPVPTLTVSYFGFVNGDGQGVLSGSPSITTTATQLSPVGSYPITVTQGTLQAANYSFTCSNGSLTVNPAVLTVTANSLTMVYGTPVPTLTVSYSGFKNGDGQGVLGGAPMLTTTGTPTSWPGSYPIVVSQGTLAAQNYTFTFVNGVLTITFPPSTTTVTIGQSILYGSQATTLTATVSGNGALGSPTGLVLFVLNDSSALGIVTVTPIDGNDSSATLTLIGSQLNLGQNTVFAYYGVGEGANYIPSMSPEIPVTLSLGPTFGNQNVGTTSTAPAMIYTFNSDAQLSAINFGTMGAANLDFTDGGSSTCVAGNNYTAGQSCSVTVNFTPTAPGLRAGAVTLLAQGSNQPLTTWYASGVGTSPAVTIDPGTQTTMGTINNATAYGSAMDATGNLYVADKANGQVIEIAAKTLVQTVVVSQLSAPTSVALDGVGNLYIAESTGVAMVPNENGALNPADMQILPIYGLGLAQGIAEDGNDNLYIADSGMGTVLQVPAAYEMPVTVASGLTNLRGVAVDALGNVYVASGNLVNKYPAGGGTAVPMGTGYSSPQAVAVDASGTVYVADTGNARIVKVAPGGVSQSVMGMTGILAPRGIAVDGSGNLYVSDSSNVYELNRTQVTPLNFGQVQVGNISAPQGVQVSNSGNQQLAVSGLAISTNYLQQPSGGSDCSASTQLAAGAGCAIAVAFSPTTGGVLNGAVVLTDNALNNLSSQQTVSLTGTGLEQGDQQTITFPNPGTQTYGVAPITLAAAASSGLPVIYTIVSGPGMVSGSILTVTGSGAMVVEADQPGNGQWLPAPPVQITMQVNPATLTVTANDATIAAGNPLPTFTASYTGFVNGDNQSVLSGSPSLTTTAPQNPPAGSYPINADQGTLSAQNYTFTFVNGTLTVTPALAQITTPPKNTMLSGGSAVFDWSPESNAVSYQLLLGTTPGGTDLAWVTTANLTTPVSGLPTDGSYIYATLKGSTDGTNYTVQDTAVYVGKYPIAVMIVPLPNTSFSATSVTFTWVPGTQSTAYWLDVGPVEYGNTYYQSGNLGNALSATVNNLPTDGSTVYVTLWSYVDGSWQYIEYSYTAYGAGTLGVMQTPTPGSTLTGSSQSFTWMAGTQSTAYWIDAGNTPHGNQYFQSGNLGNVTAYNVTGLPTDGSAVYVTLWSLVNGQWVNNEYSYTAYSASSGTGQIYSPTPGSTLSASTVAFSWTAGTGATAYWLDIGSAPGGNQYYQSGNLGNVLTATANGLPTDGSTVYVTLYSLVGGQWIAKSYTYTAFTLTSGLAVMQSPPNNSEVDGNQATFTWSAGVGATGYWLDIGTTAGGNDVYQSGNLGNALSTTVNSLPNDGSEMYATLYTQIGGQWYYNSYQYQSGSNGTKPAGKGPMKTR